MAEWMMTRIEFIGNVPSEERLKAIHNFIREHVDYDFPFCYHEEQNWRSPSCDLEDALSIFHVLGHMCKAWSVHESVYYGDLFNPTETDWVFSVGTLTEAVRRDVGGACNPIFGELYPALVAGNRDPEQVCPPLPGKGS